MVRANGETVMRTSLRSAQWDDVWSDVLRKLLLGSLKQYDTAAISEIGRCQVHCKYLQGPQSHPQGDGILGPAEDDQVWLHCPILIEGRSMDLKIW
jgi:hypothetical protein